MRRSLPLLWMTLLALAAGTRADDKLPWPKGPHAVEAQRQVEYWGQPAPHQIPKVKDRDGVERPRYRISLDLYRPKDLEGPWPVVVLVHGGGLGGGSPDSMRPYAEMLASHGYLCVAPGYTLGEGLAPAVRDVRQAVRWVRANAKELGADPDRVALWGFSAGGWIGSCLGVVDDGGTIAVTGRDEEGRKVTTRVSTDGGPLQGKVSSKPQVVILSSGNQISRYADALDAKDPPVFSYAGEKEGGRPTDTAERFQQLGVPYESYKVPGGKHCPNLGLPLQRRGAEKPVSVARACLEFLAENGLHAAGNPAKDRTAGGAGGGRKEPR